MFDFRPTPDGKSLCVTWTPDHDANSMPLCAATMKGYMQERVWRVSKPSTDRGWTWGPDRVVPTAAMVPFVAVLVYTPPLDQNDMQVF
jgi:hypothetical protein